MPTANQQDDCTRSRKAIFIATLKKMGAALARILCQALLALLQSVVSLFEAEAVVIGTELVLAQTFVDNFVIFPINATISTVQQTTDVLTKITGYGFGPGCPSTDRVNKVAKQTKIGKWSALLRRLKTYAASAKAGVDSLSKLNDDLNKSIADLNNIINGLCD